MLLKIFLRLAPDEFVHCGSVSKAWYAITSIRDGLITKLPADMLSEIFLRLTPDEFVHCGSVSKAWYAITSDRAVLGMHNLRQKQLPLITMVRITGFEDLKLADFHVETLDMKTSKLDYICSFSGYLAADEMDIPFGVLGSCNGSLLIAYRDDLFLCNSITRRWAPLSPLHKTSNMLGLYYHNDSDEYRVLCKRDDAEVSSSYSIYHIGSGAERTIHVEEFTFHFLAAPVLVSTRLY
ncbi:hypothetical protein QOZ80_3BG0294580 [Eleusine coracana subsp. coracana]|nr:hypothetical protein QOZ80_3BG0294580 [Eleusine coracana subsp. coracana]